MHTQHTYTHTHTHTHTHTNRLPGPKQFQENSHALTKLHGLIKITSIDHSYVAITYLVKLLLYNNVDTLKLFFHLGYLLEQEI